MKKIYKIILIVLTFLVVGAASFGILNMNKTNKIDKILSGESYSYLPKEAKNYIKKVYEKSGNVLLTEKNKKEGRPYLNPEYIGYLELSGKEKEKVELIPDTYILDYSMNQTYTNSSLPSSYDLRNQNGYNFVSPIKNQGTTSICWAFASIENVETLYMKNSNQSYSDLVPRFSIRQMDYITSTKYDSSSSHGYLAIKGNWSSGMCNYSSGCSWTPWENSDNGSHELDKGGNFFTSSIAMANGITLTDESVMPWHEEKKPALVNDIYGYDKSLYEVNSTIQMPTINEDHASEELINSYVKDVKNYMTQYGGPFVGTYSPKSTCGFENVDGSKVLKTDDCISNTTNKDLGHAMQIIGWDDDYEYSYCESGTNHYSVSSNGTCSKGKLTTGKGAWILRNSWGTETADAKEYSYIYLTYDSTRLSIGFTTSISDMKTRTWDNNYHSNPWIERKISNGMLSVNNQTKEFNTHNDNSEKIEKIKFLTSSKNGTYNISILTENKNYDNIGTITATEAGIYTIDLSDKNIILDGKIFSVKIKGEKESQFINDSVSVFTSNSKDEPSLETNFISGIKTYEDPKGQPSKENVAFVSSSKEQTIKLEHYLKNISDYKKITYKAILDGTDYSRYFFDDYSSISSNMVYVDGHVTSTIVASKENWSDIDVCGKTYTFQILYDDVVIESFPLKRICDNWDGKTKDYTKSEIRFHKNDGSGYFSTITKNDTTTFKIMKKDGTGDAYIGDESKFFQYDRYIKSWNTKPDGTGISYTDNDYFVYKDVDLYAQWSDPQTEKHQYTIYLSCGNTTCAESYNKSMKVTFNEDFIIPDTHYQSEIENKEFIHWTFDENQDDPIYYEEEIVRNISRYGFSSPYNKDETFYLYGVWSDSYNSVTFDANNGFGTMKGIKIIKDKTSRLKYNLFERTGYTFVGWNTKADGTGTSYTDGQKVSLTEDITLYAQWQENAIKVTFNANNGTTDSLVQNVPEFKSTKLSKNTFVNVGYKFIKWNTKPDGTGVSYADEQEIKVSEDLVLYAQWKPETYKLTFDANGGIGAMNDQIFSYGISQKIAKNLYTKSGYEFEEWNTKVDGTGISYKDMEEIKLSENLTLFAQWGEVDNTNIKYRTHVQDYGWQGYVKEGEMSGTSGKSKRLEAIDIKLDNAKYSGSIEYKTHIQNIGWESNWKKDGEISGTSGKSYRLEAIKIKLTGEISEHYDIYYRVHAENFGWLDWAKNGESAGTAGYAYRLEGIEIKLLKKDSPTLNTGSNCYEATINYRTHVQDYGWQEYVNKGEISGTSGQSKRLEGIQIKFSDNDIDGTIEYRTHIQDIGWESEWKRNGKMSGTSGQSKRLEAIQIRLTGELAEKYDIYYKVHAQNFGWLDWAKNGESAGTAGYAYRLEGIVINLVKKGTPFPVETTNHFYER